MGKIAEITTLGLLAVGGFLLLKNWGAIKEWFGGIGDWFGGGIGGIGDTINIAIENVSDVIIPGSSEDSIIAPLYVPPADIDPEDIEGLPEAEDMPISPPDILEFIFPPLVLLPDEPHELEVRPPLQPPNTLGAIFPPLGLISLLPTEQLIHPEPFPTYEPSPSDVWIEDSSMVSDPGVPVGVFGGR